jgi:hypothetical protein
MMSAGMIREIQAEAAERAAQDNETPYMLWPEDLDLIRDRIRRGEGPAFPFPFIGDYVPRGWEMIDNFMADSSGFGAPDEPALTPEQMIERIKPGMGYAIIEAGQFQVVVGEFRCTKYKG